MDTGGESYRRYLAGDDKGLTEIVACYKDHLILFINTYVHDFPASEDLCEDVFSRSLLNGRIIEGRVLLRLGCLPLHEIRHLII